MTQFRKAERSKAKLRLGLCGPAGSGKTYTGLTIAKGMGGKTALIDSEAGSGDLYANAFDYDILQITAPFTCEKYIAAIKAAETEGYDNIIIDSLSHAWSGEGGLLDQQGKWAEKDKNSYTAWRHVTPLHNKLIETMLQSKANIIATMRSKVEYVLSETTNAAGKTVMAPRKVGMAPVQREGMDYEYTVVLDLDPDHDARASKDRTGLFSDTLPFRVTEDIGKKVSAWLMGGKDVVPPTDKCSNCAKKGIDMDAATTVDNLLLCTDCATKYNELKK